MMLVGSITVWCFLPCRIISLGSLCIVLQPKFTSSRKYQNNFLPSEPPPPPRPNINIFCPKLLIPVYIVRFLESSQNFLLIYLAFRGKPSPCLFSCNILVFFHWSGVIFEKTKWTHFRLCQIVIGPQFQNFTLKCCNLVGHRASKNINCYAKMGHIFILF